MADDLSPSTPTTSASDGAKMAKATAGIGAFVVVGSAVTGLITKMFLSRVLGTGSVANAYNYVFRLTQAVFRSWDKLIRPVFLPVLATERERVGEKESWRFVSSFFNIQAVILALLTVAGMALAPWLVSVLTNFAGEDASLAARYLAVMAPSALFLALAVTGYMLLNSYKRFQLAAFGENVFVKVVPLAALLGLYWFFGIYALIVGVVLGALAKLALYAWGLRRELRNWRWRLDLASPAMKHAALLMLPLSVGVAAAFVRDRIEDWFLSHVHAGQAMTIVTYSRAPVDIPVQIFPVALAIAVFPFLSDYVARKQHDELFDVLGKAVRIIFLAFLPLTVALVLLAHPLVEVVFGGGKFSPDAVQRTAEAAQWYALGYVFFALEIVLLQFFYAARDTVTPTWTGIVTSALQIGFLWVTVDAMTTSAFNLAYSTSKLVKVLILAVLLARAFPHEHLWRKVLRRTLPALGKIALVTVAMGLAVWGLTFVVPAGRSVKGILGLAVISAVGAGLFAVGVHVLGVEEWHDALGWVKRKLKRS